MNFTIWILYMVMGYTVLPEILVETLILPLPITTYHVVLLNLSGEGSPSRSKLLLPILLVSARPLTAGRILHHSADDAILYIQPLKGLVMQYNTRRGWLPRQESVKLLTIDLQS